MSTSDAVVPDPVESLLATADPLETFKERLAVAVKAHVLADLKRAPYMYEETERIDLDNLESDKVEKLVFGENFAVIDEWDNNASDNSLGDQDADSVKEAIKELLSGELEVQFQALVEHLEADEDELQEELIEDEGLSYYQLDLHVHSVEYKYDRVRLATAELSAFSLDPASYDLFEGLQRLGVDLDDFLREARTSIESQYDDGGALSDAEIKMWGMEGIDDDVDESMSWADQYCSLVNEKHDVFVRQTDRSTRGSAGTAAIKVSDMIEMARDSWGTLTFYVHIAVGEDAISNFGLPSARHDLASRSGFSLNVHSGWLAKDTESADTMPYAAPIAGTLEVNVESFRVQKDGPATRDEDTIGFTPRDIAYIELRRNVEDARGNARYREPLDDSCPEDVKAIAAAADAMSKMNWWSARVALDASPDLEHPFLREVVDSKYSIDAQRELDLHLLRVLREFSATETDLQKLIPASEHIKSLLDIGARCDVVDSAGTTSLDWACKNLVPVDLVKRMLPDQGSAEYGSVANALSRCIGTMGGAMNWGGRDNPRMLGAREIFGVLMDAGFTVPMPSLPLRDDAPFGQLLRIDDGGLLDRALSAHADIHGREEHAVFCTALLRRSVNDLRSNAAAVTISQGADMDLAEVDLALETKRKRIEEQNYGREDSMSQFARFSDVIRACRAREAAMSSLKEFGLSL